MSPDPCGPVRPARSHLWPETRLSRGSLLSTGRSRYLQRTATVDHSRCDLAAREAYRAPRADLCRASSHRKPAVPIRLVPGEGAPREAKTGGWTNHPSRALSSFAEEL